MSKKYLESALTEERIGKCIQGDDDGRSGEETSKRGSDTGLGLDCRPREGSGSRISVEQRPDRVCWENHVRFCPIYTNANDERTCNTNSNEFLIRIDFVSVNTAEGCPKMNNVSKRTSYEAIETWTHTWQSQCAPEA